MVVERTSTSLVRYLGATVKATQNQATLANVIIDGQGRERARNASVRRLANKNQGPAAIKINDFQSALGFLERRGAAPLVAKAMAAVFVDAAKSEGLSVMALLESANPTALSLVNASAFTRINQLRDLTSQLSGSIAIDNSTSTKSRLIQP